MQQLLSAIVGGKSGAGKGGAGLFGGKGGREYRIAGRRLVEERPISEGGFSFVVLVRDVEEGELYALKKILCQDEESFASAQREVDILENLPAHKNIVGYFGHHIVQKGGKGRVREVLILLELCTGGHLLDFLDRHKGVLSEANLLKAFLDVSEAIFCLHSHSPPIQHRDLKLENVLLGKDGFWKVVDFGSWSNEPVDLASVATKQLAIISEEFEKHTTMIYRPPEMVDVHQRFPVTCAVDIWMLGCVLYTLMYNRHPFQDSAAFAIRNANYTIPERMPKFSSKLIDLLIWLLSQDPRHRPNARKLVTLLWQWDDLDNLELPEVVEQRRRQVLNCASAFQPNARANGAASGKISPSVKKASMPKPQQPDVASNIVIAPVTPWGAFEDSPPQALKESTGEAATRHGAVSRTVLAQDDWAFDGFQSAGPEKTCTESLTGTLTESSELVKVPVLSPETVTQDFLPEGSAISAHEDSMEKRDVPWDATSETTVGASSEALQKDTLPQTEEIMTEETNILEDSMKLGGAPSEAPVETLAINNELLGKDLQPEDSIVLSAEQTRAEDSIGQGNTPMKTTIDTAFFAGNEAWQNDTLPQTEEILIEETNTLEDSMNISATNNELLGKDLQPEDSATLSAEQTLAEDSMEQGDTQMKTTTDNTLVEGEEELQKDMQPQAEVESTTLVAHNNEVPGKPETSATLGAEHTLAEDSIEEG